MAQSYRSCWPAILPRGNLTADGAIETGRPTHLSFPAHVSVAGRTWPRLLGDIVIAYETTRCEAAAEEKLFEHHVAHLAVHGFLHLLGYDHAAGEDARAMEQLEISILARLDVPDPYIQRDTIAD